MFAFGVLRYCLNVRVHLAFVLCLFVFDCMLISGELALIDCVYCACLLLCVTLLFECA